MSLALACIMGLTAVAASGIAAKKQNKQFENRIIVGGEKDLRATQYQFNDAGKSELDIWSASKIESYLDKNSPAFVSSSAPAGNVAFFGGGSELVDRGFSIDDSRDASANVLWSSAKVKEVVGQNSDFMLKVPSAQQNNFCSFDGRGQVIDSGVQLDDSANGAKNIWSSQKILETVMPQDQMKLVSGAKTDSVAVFDAYGQVVSSEKIINDAAAADGSIIWTSKKVSDVVAYASASKLSKVSNPTENNLVVFDGSGGIIDSGFSLNDQNISPKNVWSSSKIVSSIDGAISQIQNAVSSQISTQSDACSASIAAASQVNSKNIESIGLLSNELKTKMNLVEGALSNRVAIFNSSGQCVDSGNQFNDVGNSKSDLWSAEKIDSEIAKVKSALNQQTQNAAAEEANVLTLLKTKMNLVAGAVENNIGVFDGYGQVVDGGFFVDDSSTSVKGLWTSRKINSLGESIASNCTSSQSATRAAITDTQNQLSRKMDLQPTAKTGSVAIFNGTGQAVGSTYFINDAGVSANDLWTAAKMSDSLSTKVSFSGSPVVNNLAVWNSQSSVYDAGFSINDAQTTTSNLWTASKTKNYFDSKMMDTYANKCWFRGFVNENVNITSAIQNMVFTITDAASCVSTGSKTSVALPRPGAYQVNLWLLLKNISSSGKLLSLILTPTQKLLMPIYAVNGVAAVSYQSVASFQASSAFTISLQIVNQDGITPAAGTLATVQTTTNQGNLFSVQEM